MNKKIFCILFCCFLIISLFSLNSDAATKVKTIKTSVTDSSSEEKIIEKSPAVKRGTTLVKPGKSRTSYVKFTAPKTKTYTFTFSPVFTAKQQKDYVLGYFQICSVTYDRLHTLDLKTNGGTYYSLNVANKMYADATKTSTPKSQRYLTKRSTKIKIKKGESVYISRYFEMNEKPVKVNYKLNIK